MVHADFYGAGTFSCCRDISSIGAQGGEGVPTTETAAEAETISSHQFKVPSGS